MHGKHALCKHAQQQTHRAAWDRARQGADARGVHPKRVRPTATRSLADAARGRASVTDKPSRLGVVACTMVYIVVIRTAMVRVSFQGADQVLTAINNGMLTLPIYRGARLPQGLRKTQCNAAQRANKKIVQCEASRALLLMNVQCEASLSHGGGVLGLYI